MRHLILACSAALLVATAVPASAQQIASRALGTRALPRVAYRGNVVAARGWTDRLGENVLLVTKTGCLTPNLEPGGTWCGDFETYAYHYVRRQPGGAYTLLWRTTDAVRECGEDVTLEPSARTVAITDLDADGVAETTFVYLLACRGGVDPAGMKLIMHEGATKYAIRGSTDMTREIGTYGRPTMNLDAAFQRAPASFRRFAVAHWNRFVRESTWNQH